MNETENIETNKLDETGWTPVEIEQLVIKRLAQTCGACPSQWEGWLDDGRAIYVRYRWGYLSICISSEPTEDIYEAVRGEEIFGERLGGGWEGVLEVEELIEATKNILKFPESVL